MLFSSGRSSTGEQFSVDLAGGRLGKRRRVLDDPRVFVCGQLRLDVILQLAGEGITSLLAPVIRVTGFDTVMPLYRYEQDYLPGVNRIVDAVKQSMEYR